MHEAAQGLFGGSQLLGASLAVTGSLETPATDGVLVVEPSLFDGALGVDGTGSGCPAPGRLESVGGALAKGVAGGVLAPRLAAVGLGDGRAAANPKDDGLQSVAVVGHAAAAVKGDGSIHSSAVMAAAAIQEVRKTPKQASPRLAKNNDIDSMRKAKKRAAWKKIWTSTPVMNLTFCSFSFLLLIFQTVSPT